MKLLQKIDTTFLRHSICYYVTS